MRTSPGCGKSRESLPEHLRVYGHLESWKFKGVSVCVWGGGSTKKGYGAVETSRPRIGASALSLHIYLPAPIARLSVPGLEG